MTAAERSFYAKLGLNLRGEMMRSGLNQRKLAYGMRVDPVAVCLMLGGQRQVTVPWFIRMIRFIGTSVNAVITPEVHALAERTRLAKGSSITYERKVA